MDTPLGGRARGLRLRMRLPGPDAASPALNWIGHRGRTGSGLCPQRRAVARHHSSVTSVMSDREDFRPEGDVSLSCMSDSPLSPQGRRCLGQEQ
jgi:hypothetical protein